jgi:hypothetical protein
MIKKKSIIISKNSNNKLDRSMVVFFFESTIISLHNSLFSFMAGLTLRGQCYTTFYVRNLRVFVPSYSVC